MPIVVKTYTENRLVFTQKLLLTFSETLTDLLRNVASVIQKLGQT